VKKHAAELSVGVFVLIGLICVAYLTIRLGKMEILGGEYYSVTARFTSVSGLKRGAVVDIAGVQIGRVDAIELDVESMLAVVHMKIKKGVPLADDVSAAVRTSGLIGDKYIKLAPGGSDIFLEEGDEIVDTQPSVDLEEILGKYAFGDV
jgi:phospholipid/cholesterol/gamma-HCH transport system substrate-binding protein